MNTEFQEVIMNIIVNAGQARSLAMQAVSEARQKNLKEATKKLEECDTFLNNAHNSQTQLLSKEANDEKIDVTLLLVHAQDHLMNAITVKDLATEFVNLYNDLEENNND